MLFKKTTFLAVLFVGIFVFFVLFRVVPIRDSDRVLYKKLSQHTSDLRSSTALERHPSSQIKIDAQKDVWLTKNGERSHFQLQSDASEFSLQQRDERIEAREELENLVCTSAFGELYAEKGAYTYPEYTFVADAVECIHSLGDLKAQNASFKSLLENKESLLLSGGVALSSLKDNSALSIQSERAFMQADEGKREDQTIEFVDTVEIFLGENTSASGDYAIYKMGALTLFPKKPNLFCHLQREQSQVDANEIHFDLNNETIECHQSRGSLFLEEQSPIFFSGGSLLWQKKKNSIELIDNVQIEQSGSFSAQANRAHISLLQKRAQEIQLQGNVQLFSPNLQQKETFALADSVEMDLVSEKIILKSTGSSRVLFWQDGMRLSAPEVHVSKECIQGKGDLRFTFNSEEQNMIEQFISKYL